MAKPLLAGNWKMHGTVESVRLLAGSLSAGFGSLVSAPEILLFPSLVHIPVVLEQLRKRAVFQSEPRIAVSIYRAPSLEKCRHRC